MTTADPSAPAAPQSAPPSPLPSAPATDRAAHLPGPTAPPSAPAVAVPAPAAGGVRTPGPSAGPRAVRVLPPSGPPPGAEPQAGPPTPDDRTAGPGTDASGTSDAPVAADGSHEAAVAGTAGADVPPAPRTGDGGITRAVAPPARRRAGADPVKALLHRHRELCERAVDPLEIAAGLEAHGITDRTAARFRHRDVFSLAEELYARTPRTETAATAPVRTAAGPAAHRAFGLALLPGALALAAAASGQAWTGPAAVAATVAALVRPGRAAGSRFPWLAHLLAAAVCGWAAHRHGPALAVGLALAVAPGHLAAVAFAAAARSRLHASRVLEDFTFGVRPLLVAAAVAFTAAAAGAAALAEAPLPVAVPLALLLFLTRLLLRHGARREPVAAALALALVPLPAAAAAAAAGLLLHAVLALSRASAHARA
ncbi:hypothetical protein ACN6AT_13480 [Streptomyces sp. JL4002]|uniref:hypothetical protein n=1 Tax=Streptomyces TaxID=1883 RepID=UPI003B27FD2A